DLERFPCLGLAYDALRAGGGAPCVMNAADEAAVAAFLRGGIAFGEISGIIEDALAHFAGAPVESVAQLTELGREAYAWAEARAKV
ncbi:MAG: 1-deoxy-D-xylulose-5-phosphate reductoisomerase, partial [Candidatus Fimadaptatus sp.]